MSFLEYNNYHETESQELDFNQSYPRSMKDSMERFMEEENPLNLSFDQQLFQSNHAELEQVKEIQSYEMNTPNEEYICTFNPETGVEKDLLNLEDQNISFEEFLNNLGEEESIQVENAQVKSYFLKVKEISSYQDFKKRIIQSQNSNTNKEDLKFCRRLLSSLCFLKCGNLIVQKNIQSKNNQRPIEIKDGKKGFMCPHCSQKFFQVEKTQQENNEIGGEVVTERRRGRKRKTTTENEDYLDALSSCTKHISSEHSPTFCLACFCPERLIIESVLESKREEGVEVPEFKNKTRGQQKLWSSDEERLQFWVGPDVNVSKSKDQKRCTFSCRQTLYDHLLTVHFRSTIASKGNSKRQKYQN